MLTDKELLYKLNDLFDKCLNKFDHKSKEACQYEINRLRGILHQQTQHDVLIEITQVLDSIISNLNKEVKAQETELNGTQNFSDYENKRIEMLACKISLKKYLIAMQTFLYRERPQLRELAR